MGWPSHLWDWRLRLRNPGSLTDHIRLFNSDHSEREGHISVGLQDT